MTDKRPVFLNLFQIHFPITAIVSILHRISGVIMLFFIPTLLMLLKRSLESPYEFGQIQDTLSAPIIIWFVWGVLGVIVYHLIAGLRHVIMDIGFFESKQASRCTAWGVLLVFAIVWIACGVCLWLK